MVYWINRRSPNATAAPVNCIRSLIGCFQISRSGSHLSQHPIAPPLHHSILLLAGREGLEPPTDGFGDRYSTNGATALKPASAFYILSDNNGSGRDFPGSSVVLSPANPAGPPPLDRRRSCGRPRAGAITLITTDTLSPGITISTPCARVTVPVTSVVRK